MAEISLTILVHLRDVKDVPFQVTTMEESVSPWTLRRPSDTLLHVSSPRLGEEASVQDLDRHSMSTIQDRIIGRLFLPKNSPKFSFLAEILLNHFLME